MNPRYMAALAALTAMALPATVSATNGYQLIGVGAYQKSLGGAVTAAPGTAMTAVSNPAGMARIGSRTDFSMEGFMPSRSADFSALGGDKGESAVNMYGVPALGWTAPVADGSDVYFGGGMFGTSGMGVDYASTFMMPASPMPSPDMYWEGYSNLSFWQMAPTLAWNVNPRYSVGVSLHIDYQSVAFKQRISADTDSNGSAETVMQNFDLSRGASGFGYGLGLGVLFDVTKSVTVGVNYKSRQAFKPMVFQLGYGDISNGPGSEAPAGSYTLDLDFPQQAALGVAFDATPAFTVSADVKWIDWSSTMGKLAVQGPGGMSVPMNPGWQDQTVYALGLAYKVNKQVNLRAGYNHAKAPFGADKVTSNLILPAIVETHYTVGGDVKLNRHWELALHYMYVPQVTMTSNDPMLAGTAISLAERSAGMNIGYRF